MKWICLLSLMLMTQLASGQSVADYQIPPNAAQWMQAVRSGNVGDAAARQMASSIGSTAVSANTMQWIQYLQSGGANQAYTWLDFNSARWVQYGAALPARRLRIPIDELFKAAESLADGPDGATTRVPLLEGHFDEIVLRKAGSMVQLALVVDNIATNVNLTGTSNVHVGGTHDGPPGSAPIINLGGTSMLIVAVIRGNRATNVNLRFNQNVTVAPDTAFKPPERGAYSELGGKPEQFTVLPGDEITLPKGGYAWARDPQTGRDAWVSLAPNRYGNFTAPMMIRPNY